MALEDLKPLIAEIEAHLDIEAFFKQHNLRWEKAAVADRDGWIMCTGCSFGNGLVKVNLDTGEWCIEQDEWKKHTIFDFIGCHQKWRPMSEEDLYREAVLWLRMYLKLDTGTVTPVGGRIALSDQSICRMAEPSGDRLLHLSTMTGLSAQTIIDRKIRWWKSRYNLPVPDEDGQVFAIRCCTDRFKESAWVDSYFNSTVLEQTPKLFGVDDLSRENWSRVVLIESEYDRMLLMQERGSTEFGALAPIGGWVDGWVRNLYGREVFLIGEERGHLHDIIGPRLDAVRHTGQIRALKWMTIPPGGVLLCRLGNWWKTHNWANFAGMLEHACDYVPPGASPDDNRTIELSSLIQIEDPVNADRRVKVPLMICGESSTVYLSPTVFRVTYCPRIDAGTCQMCQDRDLVVAPGKPEHIASCGATDQQMERILLRLVCPFSAKAKIKIASKGTWREVQATQYRKRTVTREDPEHKGQVQMDGVFEREIQHQIYARVPDGRPDQIVPRGYTAEGWIRSHPKTQACTLLVDNLTPILDPHENFNLSAARESLNVLKKCGANGIIDDIVYRRTRIIGRPELALINMLVICSPRRIQFNGETIRGWLTAAIIGDTAVGKSKTYETLTGVLGMGDVFSCLTGKRTGLSFAIVKSRSGAFRVQAGQFPLSTGKCLCVEEAQALDSHEIRNLAEAMETGRLQVGMVASASYKTETRLIFNSNPRDGRTLASYPYGCQALRDLFMPPFIRRLDLAAFFRKIEGGAQYNSLNTNDEPLITDKQLQTLVAWAWNLKGENVSFDKDATFQALHLANALSKRFGQVDDIPLALDAVCRFSLARIAAAWAVLDLSVSGPDFQNVVVTKGHVDAAAGLIDRLYGHADCALDRYSEQSQRRDEMDDYPAIEAKITSALRTDDPKILEEGSPHGRIMFVLNRGEKRNRTDLARISGASSAQVAEALSWFVPCGMAEDDSRGEVRVTVKWHRAMRLLQNKHPLVYGAIMSSGAKLPARIEE